jgi:hypothetical protein
MPNTTRWPGRYAKPYAFDFSGNDPKKMLIGIGLVVRAIDGEAELASLMPFIDRVLANG